MIWLHLTTVSLIEEKPKSKKYTSLVRNSRINMDKVNSYFEAPDEMKNHESENARVNTILDMGEMAFHVKETIQEIDEMLKPKLYVTHVTPPPVDVTENEPQEEKKELDTTGWNKW